VTCDTVAAHSRLVNPRNQSFIAGDPASSHFGWTEVLVWCHRSSLHNFGEWEPRASRPLPPASRRRIYEGYFRDTTLGGIFSQQLDFGFAEGNLGVREAASSTHPPHPG